MQALGIVEPVGEAIATGITAIPKTEYEKQNEAELKRLQARKEKGTLGLSEAQRNQMLAEQSASLENQLQRERQRSEQLLTNNGGSGAALRTAAQLASEAGKAKTAVNSAVQNADLVMAEKQRQEYWDRLAADTQIKQQRKQAIAGILTSGAKAGTEALNFNQLVKPTEDVSAALGTMFSPDETAELMALLEEYPEFATILNKD